MSSATLPTPPARASTTVRTEHRLTTTVPKEYVHRAALAEVLLTSWSKTDTPHRFNAQAQWPRGHSFYKPLAGALQDPLLVGETIRQAGLLLAHCAYGVPLGHQFLMWDLSFNVITEGMGLDSSPTEWQLEVTCHDITYRGRQLAGMRYEVVLLRNNLPAAQGQARFTCTSPAVYERIRGDRRLISAPPVAPGHDMLPSSHLAAVGRRLVEDVVLAPAQTPSGPWLLRVDPNHPILFDHSVDHVPGMLLMEAARQAAHLLNGTAAQVPDRINATFHRYAELDSPCWIDARRGEVAKDGRVPVEVTARQGGETVFTCTVHTSPLH